MSPRESALPLGQDQPFCSVSARTRVLDRTEQAERGRGARPPCPARRLCAQTGRHAGSPRAPSLRRRRPSRFTSSGCGYTHKAGKRRRRIAAIRLWRRKASSLLQSCGGARAGGARRRLLRNPRGPEMKEVALPLEHLSSQARWPLTRVRSETGGPWLAQSEQRATLGFGVPTLGVAIMKKQIQNEPFRCVWVTAAG